MYIRLRSAYSVVTSIEMYIGLGLGLRLRATVRVRIRVRAAGCPPVTIEESDW